MASSRRSSIMACSMHPFQCLHVDAGPAANMTQLCTVPHLCKLTKFTWSFSELCSFQSLTFTDSTHLRSLLMICKLPRCSSTMKTCYFNPTAAGIHTQHVIHSTHACRNDCSPAILPSSALSVLPYERTVD